MVLRSIVIHSGKLTHRWFEADPEECTDQFFRTPAFVRDQADVALSAVRVVPARGVPSLPHCAERHINLICEVGERMVFRTRRTNHARRRGCLGLAVLGCYMRS